MASLLARVTNASNNSTAVSSSSSVKPSVSSVLIAAATATTSLLVVLQLQERRRLRYERFKWIDDAIGDDATATGGITDENSNSDDDDSSSDNSSSQRDLLPSILEMFQDMKLNSNSTISQANKRRTSVYYERARDAHLYDLVPGVRSYIRLRNRRDQEMKRIMQYHAAGNKSHRTVIVMCDDSTRDILDQARSEILAPLNHTTDITTDNGVWIPDLNLIPTQDLHVTVAIPWWWHTMRKDNEALTKDLVARFKQALVAEFHHAFQIELERIVLLGGKALVALWRCIGERRAVDGKYTIYDRHGEEIDPFIKLRRDIIKCFTSSDFISGQGPLTFRYRATTMSPPPPATTKNTPIPPPIPRPIPLLDRSNTIEEKSPGSQDGFIHTTLARLPVNCLSMNDVELEPIHRLCREATATYCGHRMVISQYRFLETTGTGGESNPCVDPIFDETIQAPVRVEVSSDGKTIIENHDLHTTKTNPRTSEFRNASFSNMPTENDLLETTAADDNKEVSAHTATEEGAAEIPHSLPTVSSVSTLGTL